MTKIGGDGKIKQIQTAEEAGKKLNRKVTH
jgi:hypothetical protein